MNIVSNSGLTPQQKGILQSIADGEDCKSAAQVNNTTKQTVKNQLKIIRKKLGADTTAQAVAMGVRRHIID